MSENTKSSVIGRRVTATLLVFLGVAGVLLVYEHRAHVFSTNGILLGLLGLCVVMHFFMHGGHGKHGGHGGGDESSDNRDQP